MADPVARGTILSCTLDGMPLEYFAYSPSGGQRHGRVLVTVHGISRNAEEHLRGFTAQAERYGAVMLAPLFPADHFRRYQRLGESMHEGRADLAFDQILQDAAEKFEIAAQPLRLFGFSGGGQFAHRYALFYPKRVERMVLSAPGWYTFPDPDRRYPVGLRSSPAWPRLRFALERALQIPTLVLVGDKDDVRDDDLNTMRRIDAYQGLNRVERGERWVWAMRALARAYDVPADFRFELVANANHAFDSYMAYPPFAERVFEFLFGPPT